MGAGADGPGGTTLVPVQLAMRRAQLCGAGGLSSLVSQFGTSPEPNGRAACQMPRAFALQPLSPPALPQRVFPLFCFARPRRRDLLWRAPAHARLQWLPACPFSLSIFMFLYASALGVISFGEFLRLFRDELLDLKASLKKLGRGSIAQACSSKQAGFGWKCCSRFVFLPWSCCPWRLLPCCKQAGNLHVCPAQPWLAVRLSALPCHALCRVCLLSETSALRPTCHHDCSVSQRLDTLFFNCITLSAGGAGLCEAALQAQAAITRVFSVFSFQGVLYLFQLRRRCLILSSSTPSPSRQRRQQQLHPPRPPPSCPRWCRAGSRSSSARTSSMRVGAAVLYSEESFFVARRNLCGWVCWAWLV